MAAAAPLAAASAGQANSSTTATSSVSTTPSVVPPGEYNNVVVRTAFTNGAIFITNVVGEWDTGELTLTVRNPSSPTSNRRFYDPSNNQITTTGGIYTVGGIAWTVTSFSSQQLVLTAPSQHLVGPLSSTTFSAPNITTQYTYTGQWDEDDQQWPVTNTTYQVQASNIASGANAGSSFPTDPNIPPA